MIHGIIRRNLEVAKINLWRIRPHPTIVRPRCFIDDRFFSHYDCSDNDPNKQQQQPPMPPPINPRILLTVFLISLILAYFTSSQEKQSNANGLSNGYISWNEFVQDMLSKGEVRSMLGLRKSESVFVCF